MHPDTRTPRFTLPRRVCRVATAALLLLGVLLLPRPLAAGDEEPAAAAPPPPPDSLAARFFGPEGAPPEDPLPDPAPYPWLWRIEGERPNYLFGTVHVADPRVTSLHPAVLDALREVDGVFTELEFDAQLQVDAMMKVQLPPGETIDQHLPPEVYASLKRFLREQGISAEPLRGLKIWVAILFVEMGDIRAMMRQGLVLDMKLVAVAQEFGKVTGGVETLDEQIGVFESFTYEEQALLLAESLDNAGEGREKMEKLLQAYLSGRESVAAQILEEETEKEAEATERSERVNKLGERLMHELLTERNIRMAERIEARLTTNPGATGLFGFGLAHFLGDDGVVELLRAKGYTITRVVEPPQEEEAEESAGESAAAASTSSMP